MLKSLKLIADPTRLRILSLLAEESLSVGELQEILGMGQSRISTQLSQLKQGELVADERSGKQNVYSCTADSQLLEVIHLASEDLAEVSADHLALKHVITRRKDAARAYFDELAGRFGKDYVPGRSWKALAEALLKVQHFGVVADLGAGEGTLAQLLAPKSEKVIAVDLSPGMVEFGSKLAHKHGLANLEYRLGDIEAPPIDSDSLDIAILSQALHHAEHPQRAIDAAFSILKAGGKLIVLDLVQHQFDQARELYADRWLGFSESQLATMMAKAGFSMIETLTPDREIQPPHFQTLLAVGQKP
jgi:ArsR family transcriptional regulator